VEREDILALIRDQLTVQMEHREHYGSYGEPGSHEVRVQLMLGDDVISSDYVYFSVKAQD